jgi:hypothetical protein
MADKEKSFNPTFENGGYWEYYKDLERQFENFLEFVPYLSGNEKTYSFRLANQILAIGAHIDSAFKEMFRYSDFSKKYPEILQKIDDEKANIKDYRELEKEYCLSKREVVFKRLPEREIIIPFQQFGLSKSPDWWLVYNSVKHNFSDNFRKATLQNTRDALAGAFLLNVIHIPAYVRLMEYRVVKPQSGYGIFTFSEGWKEKFKENWIDKRRSIGLLETPIFIYDYQKNTFPNHAS